MSNWKEGEVNVKDKDEAYMFYHTVVVEQACVMQTDKGFLDENGVSVFNHITDRSARELHRLNKQARAILAQENIDAQEVVHSMESLLISRIVLSEPNLQADGVTLTADFNIITETQEERKFRREAHLIKTIADTCEALAPDYFVKSEGAIALAADAHPTLVNYYESIQWRAGDATHGMFDETCTLGEVEDRIAKKQQEMGLEYPKKDIDDYDDDPYGDEYWE
tara:strand:+ start:1205 stop:1873 length:669 start_codon:yes stop_codon:yes gene_type:complete